MEDDEIVALFVQRDQEAIGQTAGKYGERLRSLANSILKDPPAAEECENDTYLQAWNSIPPHQPGGYLYAFLARITRHLALDVCRSRSRKKRSAPLSQLTREMEQCIPDPSDTQCQVDGVLLAQAVSGYLRTLSEENGMKAAYVCGSQNNDGFSYGGDGILSKTSNHAGGILGGISDGSQILLRAYIKPTPSISQPQSTADKNGKNIDLEIKGRHDPVIVPRAVVVVEAMAALVLTDALLCGMGARMEYLERIWKK